jgi:hypothetical protein
MLGIGQTMVALSSLAQKRDISTLWELDPVAAPPRTVQQRLMGTDDEEEPPGSTSDGSDGAIDEARSVLELQLQFAMRKHDVERVREIARELRSIEDLVQSQAAARARAAGELRVGDRCFALAKVVEWEWYHARLVNVRGRSPPVQVEYLATLDGDSSKLALPVPTVNHVPVEHVRLDKPAHSDEPIVPPSVPCVTVPALDAF